MSEYIVAEVFFLWIENGGKCQSAFNKLSDIFQRFYVPTTLFIRTI